MQKNIRKKYHHGDLRRALIDAGLVELEDQGVEGLSMRGIAARVGVSHTAPKNHFDGLRGLLTAIAARGFEMLSEEMHATGTTSAADPVLGPGEGYIRFALQNPELYKLMFSRARTDAEDPDLKEAAERSYGMLRQIASRLDGQTASAPDASRRTEWMLWSLVHGYAMLLIEGELDRQDDGSPIFSIQDLLRDVTGPKTP